MPKNIGGLEADDDTTRGPPNMRRKATRKETILSLVEMLLQANDESSNHGEWP